VTSTVEPGRPLLSADFPFEAKAGTAIAIDRRPTRRPVIKVLRMIAPLLVRRRSDDGANDERAI
jgi:hypothetical protein